MFSITVIVIAFSLLLIVPPSGPVPDSMIMVNKIADVQPGAAGAVASSGAPLGICVPSGLGMFSILLSAVSHVGLSTKYSQ